MKTDTAKNNGLLTRADAIKSSGLSESSFNRLDLEPAHREGRQTFYRPRDIVAAVLAKEAMRSQVLAALHATSPKAARAAAERLADEALR